MRPGVRLGVFVVMPNHLHGLVQLPEQALPPPAPRGVAGGSLGSIIGAFKAAVTRQAGWRPGSLWQSRFHDRIVRSERELDRIETYIALNPERWPTNPLNPDLGPAGTTSHSA